MVKEVEIIDVNYGLASSYDDVIEVNHKLQGKLRHKIIAHELRHNSGKYTISDLKNDFQSKDSYFFESFFFALRNPEALINFFPFMFSYYFKKMTWNSSAVYPFLYLGIIFSVFFLVLFKINIFVSFVTYTIFVVLINLLLLIYTHKKIAAQKDFLYKRSHHQDN